MYDFDHGLFLALNFDGGTFADRMMLAVSGIAVWTPLYALILFLVWRRDGWRGVVWFVLLLAAAMGLADIVAGIFKHNGLLGDLLPGIRPRLRPMFTPSLEGLDIAPDSLAALRRAASPGQWAVHVPVEAVGGRYGTVSAHAATNAALAVFSASVVRRRWLTCTVAFTTLLVCYSRIYLGKHFPADILWGLLVGIALGCAARAVYRIAVRRSGIRR